jgi:hypothetical protein
MDLGYWYRRMHDPGIYAFEAESEGFSGAAIPFHFELSWRSLTGDEKLAALVGRSREDGGESLVNNMLAPEWKPPEPVLAFVRRSETLALPFGESSGPPLPGPSFATGADRGSLKNGIALGALMLLLAILATVAVRHRGQASPDQTAAAAIEMGEAGWIAEWVTDPAGSAHGRQLSLYRPSLAMSDYRLVFSGVIERKSLGWVFRATDNRNYYVCKLQASKPGAPLTLVRYGVVRGVEGPHTQVALPQVSGAGVLKVRLDAKRSRFTIYVQNQVVTDWEDDRLKTGGVGFLSEREERGRVESVRISF